MTGADKEAEDDALLSLSLSLIHVVCPLLKIDDVIITSSFVHHFFSFSLFFCFLYKRKHVPLLLLRRRRRLIENFQNSLVTQVRSGYLLIAVDIVLFLLFGNRFFVIFLSYQLTLFLDYFYR